LTIATVTNPDMIVMQRLSRHFEARNPHIRLEWVVLEENVPRQRVTTDIAASGSQFDILTMGSYEVPLWARQGWLALIEALPDQYDLDDVLKPVRDALSYKSSFVGRVSGSVTRPTALIYLIIAKKLADPEIQLYRPK
jgi:sorbitol/mannitol transport system substrate-binding protein